MEAADASCSGTVGFSPGLKAPSRSGRRLIITHSGSDSGFFENGLNVFESRRTGDYHKDMDSAVFITWFSSILSSKEPGEIVMIDNAPYHSRRTEKLPTLACRKGRILKWLQSKNLVVNTILKIQLLQIVQRERLNM
ncbi:hypothetical protein NQ317_007357 [Molorchus minor]|uniref:Tc1-like transposase DDE domain-containing protein n=1 Tax=Molorchus minor TaxID=1323400 RepID=A0ABQ9JBD6_9CUCU|nr:hypothetical protein NQ317_007357 [Molorchus minor]